MGGKGLSGTVSFLAYSEELRACAGIVKEPAEHQVVFKGAACLVISSRKLGAYSGIPGGCFSGSCGRAAAFRSFSCCLPLQHSSSLYPIVQIKVRFWRSMCYSGKMGPLAGYFPGSFRGTGVCAGISDSCGRAAAFWSFSYCLPPQHSSSLSHCSDGSFYFAGNRAPGSFYFTGNRAPG